MTHADIIAEFADLRRRMQNLLRVGVIASTDYPNARVKVAIGQITTDWLPWLAHRAGGDTAWHAPEIGEQVLVLAPTGDLTQGCVLPAIYSNSQRANASAATVHRMSYADGALIEYDRSVGALTATGIKSAAITASGPVTIKATSITLDGPVTTTASLQAVGQISDLGGAHGTVDTLRQVYNQHTHTGNLGKPTSEPDVTDS